MNVLFCFLALSLGVAGSSDSSVIQSNENCPKYFTYWPLRSLDLQKLQGVWYEIWTTFTGRECSFLEFVDCDNEKASCEIYDHAMSTKEKSDTYAPGHLKHSNDAAAAERGGYLNISFGTNADFTIFVVDTDYENCTLGYVCGVSGEYLWIYSRTRESKTLRDQCRNRSEEFMLQRGIDFQGFFNNKGRLTPPNNTDVTWQTGALYEVPQKWCPNPTQAVSCAPYFNLWALQLLPVRQLEGTWFELETTMVNRSNSFYNIMNCNKQGNCEITISNAYPLKCHNTLLHGRLNQSENADGHLKIWMENKKKEVNDTTDFAIVYIDSDCMAIYICGVAPHETLNQKGAYISISGKTAGDQDLLKKCHDSSEKYFKRHGIDLYNLQSKVSNNHYDRYGMNVHVSGYLAPVSHP